MVKCLGTGSRLFFALVRAWWKETEGESVLLYFKGQTALLIVIGLTAKDGIILRICREPVLEAGVVGVDDEDIATLVKEYFCCLVGLLNSGSH